MKLPLSWLRDWIDVEATPERIAEALTRRGFYVEGIESPRARLSRRGGGARARGRASHPNADKLSLCRVDGGGGRAARRVRRAQRARRHDRAARHRGRDAAGRHGDQEAARSAARRARACCARRASSSSPTTTRASSTSSAMLGGAPTLTVGQPLDELLGPPDDGARGRGAVQSPRRPRRRRPGARGEGRASAAAGPTPARARLAARWPGARRLRPRARGPRGLPALHRAGDRGRAGRRRRRRWLRAPARGRRPALDQQHRRPHQPRAVRVRPAAPRLRSRPARRARDPRAPRARRGDAS